MLNEVRHAQFVDLLRRHQQQLFAYIFALLRNPHDTEDLFQQASLIWWNKFDQFEPDTNFVAWACRIARLEVMNFYKTSNRGKRIFGVELQEELVSAAADESVELSADRMAALDQCMKRLAQTDRELLELAYGEELSTTQIATYQGRPIKSVYNSLGRIRRALQECIHRTLAREGR